MKILRSDWLNILLLLASFAVVFYFYDRLPDPMPTHWDASWQPNGFTPKPWGPFIMPIVSLGVYLLFLVLPAISPQGYRIENFARIFRIIRGIMVAMLFLMNIVILLMASGAPVSIGRLMPVVLGLTFAILGNYLSKVTKNFFVGIRTPWTLASDEVWYRTHRIGGKLFVIAGVAMIIGGALGLSVWFTMTPIALAALIPVVYSYVIYKKVEGFKGEVNQ